MWCVVNLPAENANEEEDEQYQQNCTKDILCNEQVDWNLHAHLIVHYTYSQRYNEKQDSAGDTAKNYCCNNTQHTRPFCIFRHGVSFTRQIFSNCQKLAKFFLKGSKKISGREIS